VKAQERLESVHSLRQMEMSPDFKLGIGDFFVSHPKSLMKVVALEFVEYFAIPMQSIARINENILKIIEEGRDKSAQDTLEVRKLYLSMFVLLLLTCTIVAFASTDTKLQTLGLPFCILCSWLYTNGWDFNE
jgi:amino acid permease